jgi:glucose uptake protein GlcU
LPVTATLLAITVLGEWPSAAAICIIALGVGLTATSANENNKQGENQ